MEAQDFSTSAERDALCGFLDLQRAALIRKIEGVSDADARAAPTASSLSLLGLIKHSALWERRWFEVAVAGRNFPGEWPEGKWKGMGTPAPDRGNGAACRSRGHHPGDHRRPARHLTAAGPC
jgi:hypothetical protein